MSSRNVVIGVIIALAALCACGLALLVVGGAGTLVWYRQAGPATAVATLNPTQVVETMDAIQAFVITTRGLKPTEPVEREFLTVEEVRQRVIDDFEEDTTPEELADDVRVLAAFGLVEPDLDLYNLLIRLYSEGVAGFYDPDSEELVLVSDAQGFNAYERVTFAHEYNHALQDQVFGIRESGYSDEMWESDPERATAIQAVLEGDASLLEEQYKETLSRAELREYDAAVADTDVSIYFEMPEYLLHDFLFPYTQGLEFVRHYYEAGGWPRVDALWEDPPVSTEHILHPEQYEAGDLPVPVARPALTDTLGSGWRLIDETNIGEWYTFMILAYGTDREAQLSVSAARRAAAGWGGDGYVAYYNDASGELVLAAEWVWDSEADAAEFADAFRDYGAERFGEGDETTGGLCWQGDQAVCFYHAGDRTLWVMAPAAAILEEVVEEWGWVFVTSNQ